MSEQGPGGVRRTTPNPYIGSEGIERLALDLRGDENVYLGVRPFGFHAGNMVSLIAYPTLLCEALERLGKEPRFKFRLFLNDYEQYEIDGPEPKVYRYNIYPKDTTIQFARFPDNGRPVADYWCPIITGAASELTRRFTGTSLHPIRTSEMKQSPTFRAVLTDTLRQPDRVAEAIRRSTGRVVLDEAVFALPLYPDTHHAAHDFDIHDDDSITLRRDGTVIGTFAYEELDYWFHHKPMALPRLHDFAIELCVTGIDHSHEGDFAIRAALIEEFGLQDAIPQFRTLYAPTLLAVDGDKMSKSRGNTVHLPLDDLLEALRSQDAMQLPLSDVQNVDDTNLELSREA